MKTLTTTNKTGGICYSMQMINNNFSIQYTWNIQTITLCWIQHQNKCNVFKPEISLKQNKKNKARADVKTKRRGKNLSDRKVPSYHAPVWDGPEVNVLLFSGNQSVHGTQASTAKWHTSILHSSLDARHSGVGEKPACTHVCGD